MNGIGIICLSLLGPVVAMSAVNIAPAAETGAAELPILFIIAVSFFTLSLVDLAREARNRLSAAVRLTDRFDYFNNGVMS